MTVRRNKMDLSIAAQPKRDPVVEAVEAHETTEERSNVKTPSVHSARLNVPVTPDDRKAFNILKANTGKQGPELMAEALSMLFSKYQKDSVR